jgi:hypothetical protein
MRVMELREDATATADMSAVQVGLKARLREAGLSDDFGSLSPDELRRAGGLFDEALRAEGFEPHARLRESAGRGAGLLSLPGVPGHGDAVREGGDLPETGLLTLPGVPTRQTVPGFMRAAEERHTPRATGSTRRMTVREAADAGDAVALGKVEELRRAHERSQARGEALAAMDAAPVPLRESGDPAADLAQARLWMAPAPADDGKSMIKLPGVPTVGGGAV